MSGGKGWNFPSRKRALSGGVANLLTARTPRQKLALAAAFTLLLVLIIPINDANAGAGGSTIPALPTTTTVGATFPSFLEITNNSNASEAVGTVTVTQIRMVPSCSNVADPTCTAPGSIADPGTFTLNGPFAGRAGTGCAGQTFTATVVNPATGQIEFTPTVGSVVLQQPSLANDLDTCIIDYTVTVNKVPNHDAFPGSPGVQTAANASAVFTHENGTIGFGSGSDVTTIAQAIPAIVTQVSAAGVQNGTTFTDTATLSGLVNPVQGPGAGSVTYSVFGPNDPTCAGPDLYTGADDIVTGNGDYTSDPFTPPGPGTYFWVVSYTGDANNVPVTSPCGAPNENVRVIDIVIDKTVAPPSQPAPTGTFTYTVVVTNPTPFPLTINTLTDNVYGNIGTEAIEPGDPVITANTCDDLIGDVIPPNSSTAPCSFVGTFTGLPGDTETDIATVVVTDAVTGATATDSDDAVVTLTTPPPPTIAVDKTASPLQQQVPGGDFTFTVVVTNTGPIPITITSLDDDIYGNIGTEAIEAGDVAITGNTCDDLIGDTLAPGASSAPCSFTGPFNSAIPASQTDIVTVVGTDFIGRTATDSDDAVVTLVLPPPPTIAVDKTASPLQQDAPSGTFTFTVVVTNTGTIPITITSLDDDIYGNIGTDAIEPGDAVITGNTCDELIGDVLAPGASSAPCSFTGQFNSPVPASQTDIVTVVGTDDFGRTATDSDDAIVSLVLPAPPQIAVNKTATPLTREAPGGDFTFNVEITNPGPIPVTITSLDDDIYGNIGTEAIEAGDVAITGNTCDDLIGDTLAASGGTASCSFTGPFNGAAGDSQTDVVEVVGTDDFGRTVTDDDDAVVSLIAPPPPLIQVDKSVIPPSLPVPGGDFTFTVIVTNIGTRPLTITSLNDDIYGNIGAPAFNGTCDEIIGDTLAPGASTSCTFVGPFNNATPASQTDIVTVVGTDAAGTTVTDNDDAIVTLFTPTAPQIDLVKTADPLTRVVPGGDFTFNVVVSNPGTIPVTITSLVDNIYGDIGSPAFNGNCDELIGDTLAPGGSADCSFVGPFTNPTPASQTDIVTVTGTGNGQTVTADDDAIVTLVLPASPDIAVDKVAAPLQQQVPGGGFTFSVVVTNDGPIPITITSLEDDVYGNIGTLAIEPGDAAITGNTCNDLIGDTLAPGASTAPCSFVGQFNSATPAAQTDIVTVFGTDEFGRTATDADDATVSLVLPALPQIVVDKTAAPLTREAPGGDFTFNVVITNPGPIPVTITSLTDDIYGNLLTRPEPNTCDDLAGDVLAASGGTASCSFTAPFNGAAGASQTDVVTVVGTDDFGRTVTDNDDAVVNLIAPPAPLIQVDKTVAPPSLPIPGGNFTFTVVVTNIGTRPLTITSLNDDIYGNIGSGAFNGTCDDLIGDTLAPAANATCTFVGPFNNAIPASQTDIVIVVGTDAAGTTVTDNDDAIVTLFDASVPQIDLVKTADPLTRTVPGGDFTFNLVVTNPGTIPVTITSLVDDVYGNLGTRPGVNSCDDLIGDVLAPGGNATCSFVGPFTGTAGQSQVDVVTVTGTGNGQTVTADDDAIVALVAPPPLTVVVDKTASPLSRPVPGGDFTFTVIVSNPGTVPLTITSLTDNIYGDIGAPSATSTCDDLIGTVLAPGASSAPCSFTRTFTGGANASQTDIVTVIGTDQFGQTATDTDDATVTLTPVPLPVVQVDKSVTPGTRVVPGGDFTFSVVVSNPGTVPVVITSLVDDIYGNIGAAGANGNCDDLIGDTLAPGASTAPCSFTVAFNGVAGATQTDIVTVIVTDSIGQTATDNDDAVINLIPRPPGPLSIQLDKTATPGTRPEPGGTFTFNVVVTNTSNVPLTITSLVDDVYGNLGTRSGVNTCDDLVGDVLASGASGSCSFEGTFTGSGGDSQTDVITVTGRDEDGRTVDDDDDAEVELTDVLPQIQVVKTASPLERTAPGGSFTFRVELKNPGTEPIILIELTDDIYGDLNGKGTCDAGGTIAAGGTYTCEFTAEFRGTAGQTQTDIVTAKGEDDEGNEVTDNDDAVVKLTPAPAASPTPSPTPTKSPTPPPPPPPPPAAPKPPTNPLVRTGADLLPFFALAMALISAGFVLRSRRAVTDVGWGPGRRRNK